LLLHKKTKSNVHISTCRFCRHLESLNPMKKISSLFLFGIVAASFATTGCTPTQQGAAGGAAIGAGAGALIGNQTGRAGEGALIGAAVGGLSGALIGNQSENQYRQGYDRGRYDAYRGY
jgi:hypothetical protein